MQTDTISGNYAGQMGFKYRYDQLNRLKIEDYNSYANGSWTNPSNDYDNGYTYNANGSILTLKRNGSSAQNSMDDMTFNYYANTNKLEYVHDVVAAGNYITDADDQIPGNYLYDAIGNRVKDVKNGIDSIVYNVYGKVKEIRRTDGNKIAFRYDSQGNRVMKTVTPNGISSSTTYYVCDASGNDMSIYERSSNGSSYIYKQKELSIYGSNRLGIYKPDKTVRTEKSFCFTGAIYYSSMDIGHSNGLYGRPVNKKEYALMDHLNAVRASVGDRKNANGTVNILSYNTYYAYGMPFVGAGKNYNSNTFRYGYGSYEKDDEIYNSTGTSLDMGARMYDPRIPVVPTPDTKEKNFSYQSPYVFAGNSPIKFTDANGEFEIDPTFRLKYPKVSLILDNADKLYNHQELPADVREALNGVDIQKVFNEKFRPALEELSTLNPEQIQDMVKPGSGPIIASQELDFDELKNGRTETNPGGKTNLDDLPGDKKGKLIFDDEVADVLEFELGGDPNKIDGLAGKGTSTVDKQDAFTSFVSTLFHEAVHFGRFKTGAGNNEGGDKGKVFEKKVFGRDVNRVKKSDLQEGNGKRPASTREEGE